jgi:hypothetical protein
MTNANENLRIALNYFPTSTFDQLVRLQQLLREGGLQSYPLQERLTGLASEQLDGDLNDLELYKVISRKGDVVSVTKKGFKYLESFSTKYPKEHTSKIRDIVVKCST